MKSYGVHHSNETSSAVLSHGTIYLVCSSNFWIYGWNTMVLPFKWNFFGSTSHGAIYFAAFYKLKFGYFVHFQPFLGVKGLKRKTNMFFRLSTKNRENE